MNAHGSPTKRALELTSRITEAICTLPAVSSPDWCDRAAEVLARITEPGVACVAIGSLAPTGRVHAIDCCGAAASRPSHTGGLGLASTGTNVGLDEQRLLTLRARIQGLRSIGPELGRALDGTTVCEQASHLAQPSDWRLGPLAPVWIGIDPLDVLVGVQRIGDASSDRVVMCQIAPLARGTSLSETDVAIARTVMPRLAARALIAIGSDPRGAEHWLTPKEYLILKQLILGKSVKRIADDIGRSPHTVHDHVKSLHRKLGASSRGELVARALGYLGPTRGMVEAKPVPKMREAEVRAEPAAI
jgi:DNA-binding CsgD family transcriptional regulator